LRKKALEDRVAVLGRSSSWPQIIADLDSLGETEIEHNGKSFVVRWAPGAAARPRTTSPGEFRRARTGRRLTRFFVGTKSSDSIMLDQILWGPTDSGG
jgi:hypothetical protein